MLSVLLVLGAASAAAQQESVPPPVSIALGRERAEPPSTSPVAGAFRVRLLQGKSGQPVEGARLRVWFEDTTGPGYVFVSDKDGVGLMPAPVGTPVRVLVGVDHLVDCRDVKHYHEIPGYNLAALARAGVTGENTCGNLTVHADPGEVVLFVRDIKWYEHLNREHPPIP